MLSKYSKVIKLPQAFKRKQIPSQKKVHEKQKQNKTKFVPRLEFVNENHK